MILLLSLAFAAPGDLTSDDVVDLPPRFTLALYLDSRQPDDPDVVAVVSDGREVVFYGDGQVLYDVTDVDPLSILWSSSVTLGQASVDVVAATLYDEAMSPRSVTELGECEVPAAGELQRCAAAVPCACHAP